MIGALYGVATGSSNPSSFWQLLSLIIAGVVLLMKGLVELTDKLFSKDSRFNLKEARFQTLADIIKMNNENASGSKKLFHLV